MKKISLTVFLMIMAMRVLGQEIPPITNLNRERSKVKTFCPFLSNLTHEYINPKEIAGVIFTIESGQQDTLNIYLGNKFIYQYIGPFGDFKYYGSFHFVVNADSIRNKNFTIIDPRNKVYTVFKINNKCRNIQISRFPRAEWYILQSKYIIFY